MNDFMEDVILPSLAWGVGIFVLYMVIWFIKRRIFLARQPKGERREQLLAEVRRMRAGGSTYQDCLQHLRNQGLDRTVADALLGEAEGGQMKR